MEYRTRHVDILKGEQKEAWFKSICPNGRIPAIVDTDNNLNVFDIWRYYALLGEKIWKTYAARCERRVGSHSMVNVPNERRRTHDGSS